MLSLFINGALCCDESVRSVASACSHLALQVTDSRPASRMAVSGSERNRCVEELGKTCADIYPPSPHESLVGKPTPALSWLFLRVLSECVCECVCLFV